MSFTPEDPARDVSAVLQLNVEAGVVVEPKVLGRLRVGDVHGDIDKFDLDFIRSRAVVLGLPYGLMPLTCDTMKAFKRTRLRTPLNAFGKPSAGLDMTLGFFGLQQEKTKIYPREWWETVWGNVKERTAAMDKVVSHCDADVRMTERFYQALLPLDMKASIKRLI